MYFCLKYKKYNRIIYRKLHFKDKIWIKIQYMEQKRHFLLTRTKNPCIIQYKGCESMIILQNGVISVGIEPYGAELSSIKNLRTNREFIWSGDSTYWSGQSPILFPIVGRLFGDSFEYGGEKYYLPKHGFARKSNFDIVRTEETEAQFRLCSSADTKRVYPFDFQLDVGFSIEEKKLNVTYRVKNTGDIRRRQLNRERGLAFFKACLEITLLFPEGIPLGFNRSRIVTLSEFFVLCFAHGAEM